MSTQSMDVCLTADFEPQNNTRGLADTGHLWPKDVLTVRFMDGTQHQREVVRKHAQEWEKYAFIRFHFIDDGYADIRIAFVAEAFGEDAGNWSALGTDAREKDQSKPTMSLEDWHRKQTVLHEFGHALGLRHEHKHPDSGIQWNEQAVYEHFKVKRCARLSDNKKAHACHENTRDFVYNNILRGVIESQHNHTAFDPHSVMIYTIPAEWTLNGFTAQPGSQLSTGDKRIIAKMYPRRGPAPYPTSLQRGDVAYLDDDVENFVRSGPGQSYPRKGREIQPGSVVEIRGGPEYEDDMIWWQVYCRADRVSGWTSEGKRGDYWLAPVEARSVCQENALPTFLYGAERAYVKHEPDDPNNVRKVPGMGGVVVGTIDNDATMEIIDGPKCVDGMVWWHVISDKDPAVRGWTSEGKRGQGYFLAPLRK